MKIKSVRAYSKNLALKRPYTIAREKISTAENIFLEITLANGITGIGSAIPEFAVVGETPAQTLANLQSDYVLSLEGRDIRHLHGIIQEHSIHYKKFPGTLAAIDIALHDAFCEYLGIPVFDYYGRKHSKMLTSVTIGIKDVQDTLEEAKEYYERGFKVLKLKTGLHAATDAERIIKLREAYGNYFTIRVDANTGYNETQLQEFIKSTAGQQIELIEQPLLPGKEDLLRKLPAETRSILAADESLKSAADAMELLPGQPYGIFNIKLMKCGGISGALKIAQIADLSNIDLFWGCNDESMVSITAALHAAFSCAHTRYLDLDGSLDLAEDVVINGFSIEAGFMFPNYQPGLGLTAV